MALFKKRWIEGFVINKVDSMHVIGLPLHRSCVIRSDDNREFLSRGCYDENDNLLRIGTRVRFIDHRHFPQDMAVHVRRWFTVEYAYAHRPQVIESPPPIKIDEKSIRLNIPVIESKISDSIVDYRSKFDQDSYCKELIRQLFSELITGEWLDRASTTFFQQDMNFFNFDSATEMINKNVEQYLSTSATHYVDQFISQNKEIAGTSYSEWSTILDSSPSEKYNAVSALEYAFWYYKRAIALMVAWYAVGMLGASAQRALSILRNEDSPDIQYEKLPKILKYLNDSIPGGDNHVVPPTSTLQKFDVNKLPQRFVELNSFWKE